ncbi:MAG: rRNA maturation RNase YbeY [Candidatus Acidiferrales bacterium]|jgi:probable rRNA maturation factor
MIVNRQHRVRVPVKDLAKFLARARRAVRLPAGSFTVCLVTDAEIARWNRAYRGKRGPTDVLSFPVDANQGKQKKQRLQRKPRVNRNRFLSSTSSASLASSTSYIGDIAIAPAVARRNARRFARTFEDEMRILILHGILHLMGYDHETDTGQMERRERRLRRALGLA